jgi:hypothetical protein
MTVSGGFTQTIDWLAFTLPKADVKDVITLIGGDWFQSETGFRGYPVAQLMTEGKTGVGKLGTGAPRNPKEVQGHGLGSGLAIKHSWARSWPTPTPLIDSRPFSRCSTATTRTSSRAIRPSSPTLTSRVANQNRSAHR